PAAAPSAPVEEITGETQTEIPDDVQPRGTVLPGAGSGPRRSRGSLPSWLLAGGAESSEVAGEELSAEAHEAEEVAELDAEELAALEEAEAVAEGETPVELSDEERTMLSNSLIDAKQDEVREVVTAETVAGETFVEEDDEEEEIVAELEDESDEEDETPEP